MIDPWFFVKGGPLQAKIGAFAMNVLIPAITEGRISQHTPSRLFICLCQAAPMCFPRPDTMPLIVQTNLSFVSCYHCLDYPNKFLSFYSFPCSPSIVLRCYVALAAHRVAVPQAPAFNEYLGTYIGGLSIHAAR